MPVAREMPKYKCHKEVWALKIAAVESGTLVFEDKEYEPLAVSVEYLTKHKPEPGGYFVVYGDGYKSFSPAAAFEDGYSRI